MYALTSFDTFMTYMYINYDKKTISSVACYNLVKHCPILIILAHIFLKKLWI